MGKAPRSKVKYYKVAKSMKVRGTNTNSLAVAKKLLKERGSGYNIYYTDPSGYWVRY